MKRLTTVLLATVALLFVASCNSTPSSPQGAKSAATAQKTEYLTGRGAFQQLFVAARAFSPDVKPYRLVSNYTKDAPVNEGKAALWRLEVASAARRAVKAFSWSGIAGSSDRGISHGTEDTYNPSNTSTQVFELPFLKIDSDQAFDVAEKHGGAELMKKDPGQPVTFSLTFNSRKSQLVWSVMYGSMPSDAKLTVYVDATTGDFLRSEG